MSITTAMTSVPKAAPALIEAFRNAPTSIISDNLSRLPGAVGLAPSTAPANWWEQPSPCARGPGTILPSTGLLNWWGRAT